MIQVNAVLTLALFCMAMNDTEDAGELTTLSANIDELSTTVIYSTFSSLRELDEESTTMASVEAAFEDPLEIKNLIVMNETEKFVVLSWDVNEEATYYIVSIEVPESYPTIPAFVVCSNNFTYNNLSPGVSYVFTLQAITNTSEGPKVSLTYQTEGTPLPLIDSVQVGLQGYTSVVKLQWEKPEYETKQDWIYGIYFGESKKDLQRYSIKTKNLTTVIRFLKNCKTFYFTIGIIGPIGVGPISSNYLKITTPVDNLAPPINVTVKITESSVLKIAVRWQASCPYIEEPLGYYIILRDYQTASLTILNIEQSRNTSFEKTFKINYGGIYDVKISTDAKQAFASKPVFFKAPHFLQPYNLNVECLNNTYHLKWTEPYVPFFIEDYKYEVVASPRKKPHNVIAVDVEKPPFIFTYGAIEDEYRFAVVLKTESKMRSTMSEFATCYKDAVTL